MTNTIIIYRSGSEHLTVNIGEDTVFSHTVMAEHQITARFITETPADLMEGDYVEFRGEQFMINQLPEFEKINNFTYLYSAKFESWLYRLYDKVFMHQGAIEFSYYGTASDFINLIASNMNQIDSGWFRGSVDVTDPKHINFLNGAEGFSCRTALTLIAEQFGLEFWLTGKTINLTKMAGVDTNLDFEYGRGKGLYKVIRGSLDDHKIVNRLYAFGGSRNIPYTYRDGAKRLVFASRYVERALLPGEKRREGSFIWDDIFPSRTGYVTTVDESRIAFTDTSLDFDLNGERIEGETASVVFDNGELAGYEFEIASYNHETKTIRLNKIVEENGYELPNATFRIQPYNQYKIIGIKLPQSYIDTAEAQLLAAATEKLSQVSRPPYSIEIDEKYMRDNGVILRAGDRVNLKDVPVGIDEKIRVTTVTFPMVNPDAVTAVISDLIPYTITERTVIDQAQTKQAINVVDRTSAELARRNVLRQKNLKDMIFDPDAVTDGSTLSPTIIQAMYGQYGALSQLFGLNGVKLDANTEGDPNHLTITAGSLVHYDREIEGLGYVWQLPAADFSGLDPEKSYYLSAKCSTSVLEGEWVISETPIKTDEESGYWHFNAGVLGKVIDGSRYFDFTKGMTFIVGGQITTGRIQSLDGLVFFDLSQGKFKMGNSTAWIDWNDTVADSLYIKGALLADIVMAEYGVIENLMVRYLETSPTGKRAVINNRKIQRSTGSPIFENNIKIVSPSGSDLVEMDDDSAQTQAVFYLTFNTFISPASIRNWDQNWSAYDSNFIGTDNPVWSVGQFTDGFPRKFTNVVIQNGSNYTYLFYYEDPGLILHNGWFEGIYPKTTIGANVSYLRNLFTYGALGAGNTTFYDSFHGIDGNFLGDDHDIIVNPSGAGQSIVLPEWINSSGVVQQQNIGRYPFGRQLRIINESTLYDVNLDTATGVGVIRRQGNDNNSATIPKMKTMILKVMSNNGSPIAVQSYRWQVVGLMDN